MKTITYYHNDVENLVRDYAPDKYDKLDDDTKHSLSYQCDFEDFVFYVIDDETVVSTDGLNGDVIATEALEEFIEQAIKYAKEETSNENP